MLFEALLCILNLLTGKASDEDLQYEDNDKAHLRCLQVVRQLRAHVRMPKAHCDKIGHNQNDGRPFKVSAVHCASSKQSSSKCIYAS